MVGWTTRQNTLRSSLDGLMRQFVNLIVSSVGKSVCGLKGQRKLALASERAKVLNIIIKGMAVSSNNPPMAVAGIHDGNWRFCR
jgi:hypothetical protein